MINDIKEVKSKQSTGLRPFSECVKDWAKNKLEWLLETDPSDLTAADITLERFPHLMKHEMIGFAHYLVGAMRGEFPQGHAAPIEPVEPAEPDFFVKAFPTLREENLMKRTRELVALANGLLDDDEGKATVEDKKAHLDDAAKHVVDLMVVQLTAANFNDKQALMERHMEQLFGLFTWMNEGIFEIDNQNYQEARESLDLGRHRLLDIINELRDNENFIFNQDPFLTLEEHQLLIDQGGDGAAE